jgi:hypothetical protein
MLSGTIPIIALSNHITFSQTQTDATVPIYCEFLHQNFFFLKLFKEIKIDLKDDSTKYIFLNNDMVNTFLHNMMLKWLRST